MLVLSVFTVSQLIVWLGNLVMCSEMADLASLLFVDVLCSLMRVLSGLDVSPM